MADEKSRWERLKVYVREAPDRVEAAVAGSLKAFPGEARSKLKELWLQGLDELGKALNHGADAYMPWPHHQQPGDDEKVVPLDAPRREPQIESPGQSAQVIPIDVLARAGQAVEGVEIGPPRSVDLGSLGDLSPMPSPESARPRQKPLTM